MSRGPAKAIIGNMTLEMRQVEGVPRADQPTRFLLAIAGVAGSAHRVHHPSTGEAIRATRSGSVIASISMILPFVTAKAMRENGRP